MRCTFSVFQSTSTCCLSEEKKLSATLLLIIILNILHFSLFRRIHTISSREYNCDIYKPYVGASQLATTDGYCESNREIRCDLQANRCKVNSFFNPFFARKIDFARIHIMIAEKCSQFTFKIIVYSV